MIIVVGLSWWTTRGRRFERAREHVERELRRFADAAVYGSDAVISAGLDGRVRHWNKDGGVSDVLVTVAPWHVDGRLAG
jgi:hypothetical protein